MQIRYAEPKDAALVHRFIYELAVYEKMEDQVVATEEMIAEYLFEKHGAEVIFAVEDGKEVGFALFFHNFSTFVGRAGLYLEDLYVQPEHRGKGYGKALFLELARLAVERNCGRMEWCCLNWNTPSIGFYRSMDAIPMEEWTTYRLAGDALKNAAQQAGA